MKLLLFEPFIWNDINDYPDLGSAMLVGACKRRFIDVRLLPTQRMCLDWFFNNTEDISELLSRKQTKAIRNSIKHISSLYTKGKFQSFCSLGVLYNKLTIKNSANFLDTKSLAEAVTLFREITALNEFFLLQEDYSVPIIRRLVESISKENPDYIGLSFYSFSPFNLAICKALHDIIKKPIIAGGSATNHLSFKGIQELIPKECIDYLIIGPGEKSLPELIVDLEDGRQIKNKGGVLNFRYGLAGIGESIKDTMPITSLDELALPDFSMSQVDRYCTPVVLLPLQFARGCSWRRCTFCTHHNGYFNEYKSFSKERIIETLVYYKKEYGCTYIVLHDEEVPAGRLESICNELLKRDLTDFKFLVYARPVEKFNDEKRLSIIKRAGVVSFNWGVESGSQNILSRIRKGTKVVAINKILKLTKKMGFSNTCWIISGIPEERTNDMEATIRFIEANIKNVDLWLVSPFSLQKGSIMDRYLKRLGISVVSTGSNLRNSYEEIEYNRHLSGKVLQRYRNIIQNKIHFKIRLIAGGYIKLPFSNRSRIVPFLLRANEDIF